MEVSTIPSVPTLLLPATSPPTLPQPTSPDLETVPTIATITKLFIPSALLDLPKEVRRTIIIYVLFPRGLNSAPKPHFSPTSTFRLKIPALLQTCGQLRDESKELYYGNFSVSARTVKDLVAWLRGLGEESRGCLGKVVIKFDHLDQKRKTKNQQINQRLAELKFAGVELKRLCLEISD